MYRAAHHDAAVPAGTGLWHKPAGAGAGADAGTAASSAAVSGAAAVASLGGGGSGTSDEAEIDYEVAVAAIAAEFPGDLKVNNAAVIAAAFLVLVLAVLRPDLRWQCLVAAAAPLLLPALLLFMRHEWRPLRVDGMAVALVAPCNALGFAAADGVETKVHSRVPPLSFSPSLSLIAPFIPSLTCPGPPSALVSALPAGLGRDGAAGRLLPVRNVREHAPTRPV